MMRPVLIRWRDAAHHHEERAISDTGLIELEEVGWLVADEPDYVTITMERIADDEAPETARLWLSIPRINITYMEKLYVRRSRAAKKEGGAA
jgi:hypothetical protein